MKSPRNSPDSSFSKDDNPIIAESSSRMYPVPTPHPDFWLYDGSIVLSVESCLFRVHQTILANHSEIFSDLFTLPQPAEDAEEMIEGCRIVHLPDSESDFVDLLNAIYRPECVSLNLLTLPSSDCFPIIFIIFHLASYFDSLSTDADLETVLTFIEGILRLSTKYIIRYLRQRCISLFLTKFPSTLDGYTLKAGALNREKYKSDNVMRAINLARQNNVLEILPYAFYCIARLPHKRILKDRPMDISWKDKTVSLIGRERLQWAQTSLSHVFLLNFQRAPLCQSSLCAFARGPHSEWHILDCMKSPNPLHAYDNWDSLNVCSDCVAYCKIRHLKGREEVWDRLPDLFELPTWDELRNAQNM